MRFKVYQDVGKQYRWTLYASNNRKLADSGEKRVGNVYETRDVRHFDRVAADAPLERLVP